MTRLILVRHGESQVTVDRVVGGPRTCYGLSDLGREQARRLRERWAAHAEFTPDLVVSSHYPRARETADIVAPAFGSPSIITDPGFGEHDPGPDCDGLTYDEFVERFQPEPDAWHDDDPYGSPYPGGESVAEFHLRVGTALRSLLRAHPDAATIVIFCHGGVVDAIFRQSLKTATNGVFQISTMNAAISEFELISRNYWRLVRQNDHAHLAGLPVASPASAARPRV